VAMHPSVRRISSLGSSTTLSVRVLR
jgi:hypothetical protein